MNPFYALQNEGMGTRFQQAIPQQFLLQNNPDRFGQPISKFTFSETPFPQQASATNNIQDTFQRLPSQQEVLLNNQFFPSNNNDLLQDNFKDDSLRVNLDRFSSIAEKLNNR